MGQESPETSHHVCSKPGIRVGSHCLPPPLPVSLGAGTESAAGQTEEIINFGVLVRHSGTFGGWRSSVLVYVGCVCVRKRETYFVLQNFTY